jgi:hypothetical protein
VTVLDRGFTNLKQPAEQLKPAFIPRRCLDPGEDVPLPVLKAMQRDGGLFQKDPFCDDLFAQQRQQAQDDVDILGCEDDARGIIVPIDGDAAQFEPDAGKHDKLDPLHLDLPLEARLELLQEKLLEKVDPGQLARIQQEQHTENEDAEDEQDNDAETFHSTSPVVSIDLTGWTARKSRNDGGARRDE